MRALPLAVLILGGIVAIGAAIGGAARGLWAGGSARSRSRASRRPRSRGQ